MCQLDGPPAPGHGFHLAEESDDPRRTCANPYVRRVRRDTLLERVASLVEIIDVLQSIRASRDAKDDKFLEAAVNGRADVLVTGDEYLLALNPFRGVAIVTPAEYLAREP